MMRIEEGRREEGIKKYRVPVDTMQITRDSGERQFLRFACMAELFKYERSRFSVHEIGCAPGTFKEFLERLGHDCEYSGSDIAQELIDNTRRICEMGARGGVDLIKPRVKGCDYYCLSGTSYLDGDIQSDTGESIVFRTMENLFKMAKKGICATFLTQGPDLYDGTKYYADPGTILDFVFSRLSRFVAIVHDLPLFEFFVYVYKEDFVRSQFPGYEGYFGRRG